MAISSPSQARSVGNPSPRCVKSSTYPFLGNILDIDPDNFTKSLGDVYMINYGSYRDVIVTSRKVAQELCDESRFCKLPGGAIDRMKRVIGNGLFTAETRDPRWQSAHRVIAPLFNPMRIRGMMDDMRDVCEQMCLRWARFGPGVPIKICDEMTKLTLDTIALCTVDHRFNSFYRPDGIEEPFAEAVVNVMTDSLIQSNLPDWINNWVRFRSMNKFNRQADELRHAIEELIESRRKNPVDRNDLLNAMLSHEDPETGQRLSDELVVDNLLTFFIAGHETTSSLLSFCMYYLLECPDVLQKARAEVHATVGTSTIMPEHLSKLPYLESVLRETLRLRDPGPGFFVKPLRDDVIAGKYFVKKDQSIFIVFDSVHRDPDVYGDDADEFRPERMSQEKFDQLPPCAYKPFGNGVRACIGRPFAMQQAILAVAMILQHFDLIKDESYKLKIHVTMTVRPIGLTMKVRPREGLRATDVNLRMHQASGTATPKPLASGTDGSMLTVTKNGPMHLAIVHASNSGTSEALAGLLASNAVDRGLGVKSISVANDIVEKLPRDVPVVIITASYNGEPSRNAADFVSWLKSTKQHELEGVRYAVFGCGHRDWASSLFAVPKLIDSLLSTNGAEQIAQMGTSDTGGSTDIYSDFEDWTTKFLFPYLNSKQEMKDTKLNSGADTRDVDLHVSLGKPPRVAMRKGFAAATVTKNRSLSAPGVPEKCELELCLPDGFTYKAGDHLQILPRNSSNDVQSVLRHFHLEAETLVSIQSAHRNKRLGLPLDVPIMASELFAAYVELGRTASSRNIHVLAGLVRSDKPKIKRILLSLANGESYKTEVLDKRISVLDLLKQFPDIEISLAGFLSLLMPIRPRSYSFSSGPNWKPGFATLTYTVVGAGKLVSKAKMTEHVAMSMRGGLASTFLSTLSARDDLYVSLDPASPSFYDDQSVSCPIIMIAAGTGIAPFIGFLQERKLSLAHTALLQGSKKAGPYARTLLFFGCRGPALDSLYTEELAAFEADGLVEVRRAFSRDHTAAGSNGCKYVDQRLAASAEELVELWRLGARVFVCGGKKMANNVFDVLGPLFHEADKLDQKTAEDDVGKWRTTLGKGRYAEEIFI
uniref:Bifunctional cytochrome P450/NADPH--P450 reductase ALT2 n=1 Tax=Alternaria alternata TaxID=5599 RepID=ALT2_ALTAL|nr:RecName: Full=Bifunctional cytochrome P450/NADPH--P450 reductase ALT2; AltName: Full=AAL-toxin biosynthesis cluster protein 2; Includes: RecName: Full=Cytochrome P450 monooxygenase; Includes: RecName: Full=NADPH--cytochrome P450 reductase [Alternaria alternata]BBG74264.1 NADPH cytochrome P450 monooxygenase [Alternaria alternata]